MRVEPLALVALLLTAPLAAAEEEAAPSVELLEFLGSFETAAGEWLDPTELPVPPPDNSAAPAGQEEE